jgi:L-aspartate oxidase
MGGIAVNAASESSVRGLFAVGEAACTGLHGANRLASNSLLEALVTGRIAAEAITGAIAPKPITLHAAPHAAPPAPRAPHAQLRDTRKICSTYLGISRNAEGIAEAIQHLQPYAQSSDAALVALLIARAALQRRESRGAHFRTDFPAAMQTATSSVLNLLTLTPKGLAA